VSCSLDSRKVLAVDLLYSCFSRLLKYFTSRNSTMFITDVDASKAFDRLDHCCKLKNKLRDRNLPSCFVRVIPNRYSMFSCEIVYSSEYKVCAGVTQTGILSPSHSV